MPYSKIFKRGNKYVFKKKSTGEVVSTSDTKAKAVGSMRARMAAEGGAKMRNA